MTSLISYFDAQLSDALYADFFPVLLMAINSKEQICYKAHKYLDHQAMLASCNKVINLNGKNRDNRPNYLEPSQLFTLIMKG